MLCRVINCNNILNKVIYWGKAAAGLLLFTLSLSAGHEMNRRGRFPYVGSNLNWLPGGVPFFFFFFYHRLNAKTLGLCFINVWIHLLPRETRPTSRLSGRKAAGGAHLGTINWF